MSRQTLVPYTFSGPDGPHVPAGNWISVPSRSIMRDPANYPSPETFDPLRFATNVVATGETDMEANGAHVKYTDATYKYPLWGLGKRIWSVLLLPSPPRPSFMFSPSPFLPFHQANLTVYTTTVRVASLLLSRSNSSWRRWF